MSLTKVKAGNILLTTPGASSNDTTPATTQYVTTAIGNLVDTAPSTLNTLNELAAALGDDVNFSTTVTNSIATKLPLAGGTMTGNLRSASFSVGAADSGEALNILDGGHTGHGAANTVSLASFAENASGNLAGLWVGSMTNENTAVIGSRTASGNIGFQTYDGSWGERMRLTSDGRLGIGTTAPAAALEVARGSAGYVAMFGAPQGSGKVILFKDNHASPNKYNWLVGTQYNTNNAFEITPSTVVGGYTFNAPAITVLETGNVGIGTNNPGGKLHVQMAHTATDVTLANSNETLVLGNSGTGNGVYNAIKFGGNQQDMYIMSFNHNTAADRRMGFFLGSVAGDAAADERLSILGNGNVGVGVAGPAAKLTVAAPATDRETIRLATYYSPIDSLSRGGITWHDGGHITGQIDTRYDGTTVDMHIGSLYSSGYNTTSRMIVKGNGTIETPLQPSFNAYHTTGLMSIGVGAKFIFDSTNHNVGNMYNTSTGRITAPVAGTYLLTFHTIFQGNYGNAYFQFYVNNARSTVVGDYHLSKNDTNTAYWQTHQFSRVVKLAKNDYIEIFARNAMTWHGTHWGGLSCHLL